MHRAALSCAVKIFSSISKGLFSAAPCMKKPSNIKNGQVRFYSRHHDALAKYSCEPGYELNKNSPRYIRCQNGNWTEDKPPICDPGIRGCALKTYTNIGKLLFSYRSGSVFILIIICTFVVINPITADHVKGLRFAILV